MHKDFNAACMCVHTQNPKGKIQIVIYANMLYLKHTYESYNINHLRTPMCVLDVSQLFLDLWTVSCRLPYLNFPGKDIGWVWHFLFQNLSWNSGLKPHLLCFLHWQVDPLLHLTYYTELKYANQ